MKFIDSIEIIVAAGNGGDGMVSFRTARNRPKLGPDGGNGGLGGSVYLAADPDANTLSRLRYHQLYKAEHGEKGGTNNKTGRCGENFTVPVPLGTVIYDQTSGELVGEVTGAADQLLVAQGGKRGYGNLQFLRATRQAPMMSTKGKKGETKTLRLELKLLADVGFAGLPNAGKSTLLSMISAARPKVADYPFTTLVPHLGVVEVDGNESYNQQSFVAADIPGLIEGASEGKGLGHAFLKHIERTSVIAMVIDGFNEDQPALQTYKTLLHELENYSQLMTSKKKILVINKLDLAGSEQDILDLKQQFAPFFAEDDILFISGATGEGISNLKRKLFQAVHLQNLQKQEH